MCVTSVIMDSYRPHIPNPNQTTPYQWPQPAQTVTTTRIVHEYDNTELRELIDSFRQALEAAEVLDRLTDQPDCVDPEKAKLIGRVNELERRLEALEDGS